MPGSPLRGKLQPTTQWVAPEGLPLKMHRDPALFDCAWWLKSPHSPNKEQEYQVLHRGEESYNLLFCGQHQKACLPKVHRGPAFPTLLPAKVQSHLSENWNPSSSTEWQSTTLQLPGGQPPQIHRDQHSLLWLTAGEPHGPIKEQEHQIPHWGRKAVTCYSAGGTEGLLPQGVQKPSTSHSISMQETPISPVQQLESQLLHWVATCYSAGARRPASHNA
jgi:hypothetical protein